MNLGSVSLTDKTLIQDAVLGNDWWAFVRMRETAGAGTLNTRIGLQIGGQEYYSGTTQVITSSTMSIYRVGPIGAPPGNGLMVDSAFDLAPTATMNFYAVRTAGSQQLEVDFIDFLPSRLTRIADSGTLQGFIIRGQEALTCGSSYATPRPAAIFDGALVEFEPGKYNHVVGVMGAPGSAHTCADVLGLTAYITPRWGLL
jgi:hypothetical protein